MSRTVFDNARAAATAKRIRDNIERARNGKPLVQPAPFYAGEDPRVDGSVTITNIGRAA